MAKELQLAALRKGQITLKQQAELINSLYHEALSAGKLAMLKAKDAGEALVAAKEACKHGEFEQWVESECDFSVETARKCMRIYTHWEELLEQHGSILYATSVSAGLDSIKKLSPKAVPAKATPAKPAPQPEKEPVDGTEECPHGGPHTYDDEACTRCHDPRPSGASASQPGSSPPPADDSPASGYLPGPGQEPEEEIAQSVSVQQLGKAFLRTDQAFDTLTNCLDELHQMHPWQEIAGMQDALNIIYRSFTKWKKESK